MGAIIVREDQIVATAMSAPPGNQELLDCGHCLRRELNIPSGSKYELCRSVHAEQNAIINAARGSQPLGRPLPL